MKEVGVARGGLPRGVGRQIGVALLLALLVAVCYVFVDRPAARWANGLPPRVVAVFKVISAFGYSAPYLIAMAVLAPILRCKLKRPRAARRALFVFASVAVSGLTTDLAKWLLGRWRPSALFGPHPRYGFEFFGYGNKQTSLPSGHATTAFVIAVALALLRPRWRAAGFAAAAVVGASRVVVGAHYPGDVLAGAWIGVVVTLALARSRWFRDVVTAPGERTPGNGEHGRLG